MDDYDAFKKMMEINRRHLKAAGVSHIPRDLLIGTTEKMIEEALDGKAPFSGAETDVERQRETLRFWNMKKKEDDMRTKLLRQAEEGEEEEKDE